MKLLGANYLLIYYIQTFNSLKRAWQYRANFLVEIFSELLWTFVYWIFIEVLLSQVGTIATWNRYEVLFLLGVTRLVRKSITPLLVNNLQEILGIIHWGELDFHLLKPASPLFCLASREISLPDIISGTPGLLLMIYALDSLKSTQLSTYNLVAAVIVIILGIICYWALILMFVTLGFWWGNISHGVYIFDELTKIGTLPPEAFSGFTKLTFGQFLPMLVLGAYPSAILLGKIDPIEVWFVLPMTLCWSIAAYSFWRLGLRNYTSVS